MLAITRCFMDTPQRHVPPDERKAAYYWWGMVIACTASVIALLVGFIGMTLTLNAVPDDPKNPNVFREALRARPEYHVYGGMLALAIMCLILSAILSTKHHRAKYGAMYDRRPGSRVELDAEKSTEDCNTSELLSESSQRTGPWQPTPLSEGLPQDLPAAFGRYELRKLLGKGGMAVVYLAHDTQLNRLVALKIPALPAEHRAAFQERFLQEARTAASLSHPGLCPVYDVGQINGIAYLTMPYIHGMALSERLRRGSPLTVGEVARIVHDVATAMQEAHGHGVIHRDLKPSNILLNERGEPVVTDFGLARAVLPTDERRLTQSGALIGTPAYMAPEQVAGDAAAVGPACDIYGLGVILYEMLTGRVPFTERGLGKLLAQIDRDPPPPPSQLRAGLDPTLEVVCLKALAKRPGDRFPNMADFAAALAAFVGTEKEHRG
jgi:serine/threonine protein kinase